MNFSEAREFYPYLKTSKIYLNHAAMSPLSTPVVESVNKYLQERSCSEIDNFLSFQKVYLDTRSRIGKLINAPVERLAFLDNTSNAINLLAQGLSWKPGDRILLNDIEFPTNVYPFMNLKTQGVEIDFVKSINGTVPFESIEAAITPKTKLISISHVQFLTGYRAELKKIGELCKSKDIIFCVDDIQSCGALRTDVIDYNIDFLACGCHKWMMSMEGLSFIYIKEELQRKVSPKYVGWLSVVDDWNFLDYQLELKKDAICFQNGTMSAAGIYALNASLRLFENFDPAEKETRIIDNAIYICKKLEEKGIKPIQSGLERKFRSGIVSYKPEDANAVFESLSKNNIVVSLREGIIRFSPHYYNTREEFDRVLELM